MSIDDLLVDDWKTSADTVTFEDGVVGAKVGDLYFLFRRSGFVDVPYITRVHSFRYARPGAKQTNKGCALVRSQREDIYTYMYMYVGTKD